MASQRLNVQGPPDRRLDIPAPLGDQTAMEKLRPQTVRRPEILRWIIIAAIGVVLFFTVAIAARSSASNPIIALINFPAAILLAWFGYAMFTAKARSVTFDGEVLTDDTGLVLCHVDDIKSVERGFALFKPSGGFALLMKEEQTRDWSPGLWWRYGSRIGIGGATPGRSARVMADSITMAMAMKEAGPQLSAAERALKSATKKAPRKGRRNDG